MDINPEVLEALKSYGIRKDDGLGYLMALHYGYRPSYIPDLLRQKVNATGIVRLEKGKYVWGMPLFAGALNEWNWVETEYVQLFEDANDKKKGNIKAAELRMQKFFRKHPSIRKDEVIEATKMYILNNDPKYIRLSQYFIEKGRGIDKTEELIEWVTKYKLSLTEGDGRTSVTNIMQ